MCSCAVAVVFYPMVALDWADFDSNGCYETANNYGVKVIYKPVWLVRGFYTLAIDGSFQIWQLSQMHAEASEALSELISC